MIRWTSDAMVAARKIVKQHGGTTPEAFLKLYEEEEAKGSDKFFRLVHLGNYFEDLAGRAQDKLLDPGEVERLMAPAIQRYLTLYSGLIEQRQQDSIYAEWLKVFGHLCEEKTTPPSDPGAGGRG